MDMKELSSKSREELLRLAAELEASKRDMRFKAATRQLAKVRSLRQAKRDLARVHMLLARKSSTS